MKSLIISLSILCFGLMAMAQSSPVDDLFNKYSDKDGFSVVTISGRMFSMFASQEADNTPEGDVISKLKSIRILSVEDAALNNSINFYTELSKKLDFTGYEELMVVKEGQDMTKFLVKQNGKIITELLVISGGPSGNSIISIRGDLDMKSLTSISKEIGIGELENLDKGKKTDKK